MANRAPCSWQRDAGTASWRRTMSAMNRRTASGAEVGSSASDEVRQIYAELARRPVERQCIRRTECCQFKLTGLTPYLTKGEALVAARALRATGRMKLPAASDGACPMLESHSGRCLIYADRPFGCRTHFCAAAGGPLARREVVDLIRRLETIDARLGGDGPRKLPGAVATTLAEIA
jgi:Fe-S-cluster containining protein